MRNSLGLGIIGAGIGAGLMYLLDPQLGRRRRAILHDKTVSLTRQATDVVDKTARDVRNRAYGTVVSIKTGHVMDMHPSILNANWPPAIRLLVGAAGTVMAAAGVAKRGLSGTVLTGIGLGSVAVAVTNVSVRDIINRAATTSETQTPARQTESAAGGPQAHIKRRNVA
ncbi:MAG TPA: hypothetical protein VKY31_06975 [Terriglobia bacterium]|nr:hypothetical protein [Terriglobia bacterium]